MMKYWARSGVAALIVASAYIAGCGAGLFNLFTLTGGVNEAALLEGYWMSTKLVSGGLEKEFEVPDDVDLEFLQFTKLESEDYTYIYEATHPCHSDMVIAYLIVYNDGSVEIECAASGASLNAVLADKNTITVTSTGHEGSWTMQKIEEPPCGEADDDGVQRIALHQLELVDDEDETADPNDAEAQAGAAMPALGAVPTASRISISPRART